MSAQGRDVDRSEMVFSWSRKRRLHLLAPTGLLAPVDVAVIERVLRRVDDLDRVADAVAQLTGHPVRVRGWEPPTSDFFVEVETPQA
jgi:hypothetical protein